VNNQAFFLKCCLWKLIGPFLSSTLTIFQNRAVSNALGSNTFNITIGLGLPWVLYTSFGTGFQPYDDLKDEGITEFVIILASVHFVFIVSLIGSGFVLRKWHAILYLLMYVTSIGYLVAQVYGQHALLSFSLHTCCGFS
jgi:Ca2+/Na+ antiporter